MAVTTIKIDIITKSRLDKLKVRKNESYDEVIREVLNLLNLLKDSPYKAKERLDAIDIVRSKEGKN